MAGKQYFILLTLFLFFGTIPSTTGVEVSVRGGLVFERPLAQAVSVNPQTVTFMRALDLQPFELASKQLAMMTTNYRLFCGIVQSIAPRIKSKKGSVYEFKLVRSEAPMNIAESLPFCNKLGGRLPEIRDPISFNQIYNYAKTHSIDLFPAGMHFDRDYQTYKYNSDQATVVSQNMYTTYSYGGEYKGQNRTASLTDDVPMRFALHIH